MAELKESDAPIRIKLLGTDLEIRGNEPTIIQVNCEPEELSIFLEDVLIAVILKDSEYPSPWNSGPWSSEDLEYQKVQAEEFVERYMDNILKGETRAFKEVRLWVANKNRESFQLRMVDNVGVRKSGHLGNFKDWLIEAFENPQLNKHK